MRNDTLRASTPPVESTAYVRDALAEFRRHGAAVTAWIRLGVHVLMVPAILDLARSAGWRSGPAIAFSAVAVATAIAIALRGHRYAGRVIVAGVAFDVAALAAAAWCSARGATPDAAGVPGLVVSLAQLVLLFASLALAPGALLTAVLAVSAIVGLWSSGAGLPRSSASLASLVVMAFGAAVVWAGARAARLAVANARLDRRNGEILAAQERAEVLTQLIVHDLKSPLTAVLSHVAVAHDALAAVPGLADEAEDLRIAGSEALRLSAMVGDLLLVSRLQRGDLKRELARVRIAEVLEAVRRAIRPQSTAKQVDVEVEAPSDLTATLDASLVRRLLENLVLNALRYTPPGGRIQLAAGREAGDVQLAVRNTGIPISRDLRAHLFERYSSHGPREYHNAGLGLYLCRLVAEAHGGRIALVDRAGWNVSFEAVLPAEPTATMSA